VSDDIGTVLGIIHRAGCMGPTTIAAMPLATMMGRNPYIVAVADGKGGELFACRLCGRLQGQQPDPETAQAAPARRGGPVPAADPRGRIVDEAIAQREPDGTWPTQATVAETLKLTDRRIRQVQGDAGWAGILEDAEVKARDR
jgi:hypothetical protein